VDREREADWQLIRELSEWRPDGGVVSIYLEIDPADRSNGWRIALKDALANVPGDVAARVTARFPEGRALPSGRGQIGFLEAEGKREEWTSMQTGLRAITAVHAPQPLLTPLVQVLDEGGPFGVVVVSLERVRVLEWSLGRIDELDGWELEIASLDWRERKAPQRDPARGTGTTTAGHDQYLERLNHNRERFLKEAGELIAARFGNRQWKRTVVIGEADRPQLLAKGLGPMAELVYSVPHDLIGEPATMIADRMAEEFEHLNRRREEELVKRIEEGIGTDPGAAVGQDAVLRALEMGQARHVIFDPDYDFKPVGDLPASERFIALALATGAEVTPVEGLAAAALGHRGGVAALLRFVIERSD
jgi:Bacterial archaeo-eukaryotic release factor family 5